MKDRLPLKLKKALFIRDEWKCRYCGSREGLHPHHVIYRSQGGEHELNNLLTLCFKCHRAEHDGFLVIKVLKKLLFNIIVSYKRTGGWKPND